jgi:hypothetical protein
MSNAPNQNGSGLEQQFAGLDLQSRASSGRYVPPHLRNKQSSSESGYDRDRGESRGGSGRSSYSRGGRDNRAGDFSSFNTRLVFHPEGAPTNHHLDRIAKNPQINRDVVDCPPSVTH